MHQWGGIQGLPRPYNEIIYKVNREYVLTERVNKYGRLSVDTLLNTRARYSLFFQTIPGV